MKYKVRPPVLDEKVTLNETRTQIDVQGEVETIAVPVEIVENHNTLADDNQTPNNEAMKTKKRSRKPVLAIMSLLLVGGGVFAAWTTLMSSDEVNVGTEVLATTDIRSREDVELVKSDEDRVTPETAAYNPEVGSSSYVSSIGEKQVAVTQQDITGDLLDGSQTLNGIARKVPNALSVSELITNKGETYLVNDYYNGQTLMFTHNDSLIIITSDSLIDDASWAEYVNSLN